jgi:hypothetical protein
MNDIEIIYDRLKNIHPLVLTNTFALDDGFTWDVPVICGKSSLGRFWLYADEDTPDPHGCDFVFSVEYEKRSRFSKKTEVCHTHWHPHTIEDAVRDADRFMKGTIAL